MAEPGDPVPAPPAYREYASDPVGPVRHRASGRAHQGHRRVIGVHRAEGLAGPTRRYLFTVALLVGTSSLPILAAISTGSATVNDGLAPPGQPFVAPPSGTPLAVVPLAPRALPGVAPVPEVPGDHGGPESWRRLTGGLTPSGTEPGTPPRDDGGGPNGPVPPTGGVPSTPASPSPSSPPGTEPTSPPPDSPTPEPPSPDPESPSPGSPSPSPESPSPESPSPTAAPEPSSPGAPPTSEAPAPEPGPSSPITDGR